MAVALRVDRLAPEPLLEEQRELLAAGPKVLGVEGAQGGVLGDSVVERLNDGFHDLASADAIEERALAHVVRQRNARKVSEKEAMPNPRMAAAPLSRSYPSQPSMMSARCASRM